MLLIKAFVVIAPNWLKISKQTRGRPESGERQHNDLGASLDRSYFRSVLIPSAEAWKYYLIL